MHRCRCKPPIPIHAPLLALILAAAPAARSADSEATFTVDVKLGDTPLEGLQVTLDCFAGNDRVQRVTIPQGDSRTLSVAVAEGETLRCQLGAVPVPGQVLQFRGDGGSEVELAGEGCLFSGVRAGHANFCQIEIEQQYTGITVYKKWIGSADPEPDVEIHLYCAGMEKPPPRQMNQGAPAGWELQVTDPDGLQCDVVEIEREEFRADMSDCQGLIVLPGAQEECTMVNTKVVKMIQMLNRYGLFIMIGIFLIAGMIASRRMIP